MPYKNKELARASLRAHYSRNRQYYIDKALKRKLEIVAFVNGLKSLPCTDCGVSYAPHVMQFDHLSDKLIDIAKISTLGWGKERILKEVKKCEVVCANCHAERTYKRRVTSLTDKANAFEA